jgi:phage terminase large subunit-like protein
MPTTEVLDRAKNWDPKAKKRLMEEVKRRESLDIQLWFCDRQPKLGRNPITGRVEWQGCDGKPHEGFEYKHARAKQWPPPGMSWRLWLVMSGRGWGKTRTGANWIRAVSNRVERSAMIGRRGVDVRATMVEGDSGLIKVCEAAQIAYDWQPSKREFTFANGHKVFGYSAEEPDSLRGPQHGAGWWDEPAHMPLLTECWMNYKMGLRLPGLPGGTKTLATSTPLPIDWLKERIAEETTFVTAGATFENEGNLDEASVEELRKTWEGTRLGRQELYGEIVEDVEGALWNTDLLLYEDVIPLIGFDRIVIAIDPAGTANRKSDETGIVVAAKIGDEYWIIEDLSGKFSPGVWSATAIRAYRKWGADAIIAEKNYGGDMVAEVIRHAIENSDEDAVRVIVTTATRSKQLRAEPVVGLYEQKRVKHLKGLGLLEKEMTTWIPGKGDSPNRIDAMVWAVSELAKLGSRAGSVAIPTNRKLRQNNPTRRLPWSR